MTLKMKLDTTMWKSWKLKNGHRMDNLQDRVKQVMILSSLSGAKLHFILVMTFSDTRLNYYLNIIVNCSTKIKQFFKRCDFKKYSILQVCVHYSMRPVIFFSIMTSSFFLLWIYVPVKMSPFYKFKKLPQ